MSLSETGALRQQALLYVPLTVMILASATIDIALVTSGFMLAEAISGGFLEHPLDRPQQLLVGIGLGVGFVAAMAFQEAYARRTFRAIHGQAFAAAVSWLVIFFLAGWVAYAFAMPRDGALSAIVTLYFTGFAVTVIGRGILEAVLRRTIATGWIAVERAFVISSFDNDARADFLDRLRAAGIAVVGMANVDLAALRGAGGPAARAALLTAIRRTEHPFDAIHVLVPWQETEAIAALREALRLVPETVYLTTDRQIEAMTSRRTSRIGGRTGFRIDGRPDTP